MTYVVAENPDYKFTTWPNQTTYQRNDVLLIIYVIDKPEPVRITNLPAEVAVSEDLMTSSCLFNITYSDDDLYDNYTWIIESTWPPGAPLVIDDDGSPKRVLYNLL